MRGVVIERTLEDEFLEVLQEHVRGAETFVLPEVSRWLSWISRALSHVFDARVDPLNCQVICWLADWLVD
jgi:hypothetical protein